MQDHALNWDPLAQPPASNTTLYLQVPLASALCWDDSTKQRMLFESFVLNGQSEGKFIIIVGCDLYGCDMCVGAECGRIVKKQHAFNYYVSHIDRVKAICFVMSEAPPIESTTPCPAYIVSLCSSITNSTTFLHDTLLDDLAR